MSLISTPDGRFVSLNDLRIATRFLWQLPFFLRQCTTVEEATEILHQRFKSRESDFLCLARRAVYQNPQSPYRKLLTLAGCEYGDLEKLVRQDGLEAALGVLFGQGVYLTVDEFKGRQPVVRGSTKIQVETWQLANPLSAEHVQIRSGGSRSQGTPMVVDLEDIGTNSVNTALVLEARGGFRWVHADWAVPGGAIMFELLGASKFGIPKARWFSQVALSEPGIHPRYRWSARVMRWGSLFTRVPVPAPEHVRLDDPSAIIGWMMGVRDAGGIPHLRTSASSAVRLSLFALDKGIDLSGVHFTMGAEPVTASRLEVVRRTGAQPFPHYGSQDCGPIAQGCLAPKYPDDLHVFHDLHGLIQPKVGSANGTIPSEAMFMSSIRPRSRLILLNVSLGDQAIVEQRQCGCPLEQLGWTTHIRAVRSYEKLTAAGMTFLDSDVIYVLEEVLPRHFGGAPTDYQLLEEADSKGRPRLKLLVQPSVGSVDEDSIREVFFNAISDGSEAKHLMVQLWRNAGILIVERRAPLATPAGKILHVHVEKLRAET